MYQSSKAGELSLVPRRQLDGVCVMVKLSDSSQKARV